MRYIVFAYCFLSFFGVYSQPGNYFLSHYSPQKDRSNNVCFDIIQSQQGLMYFATRKGILEFDGKNWTVIPGKGIVYSLQQANDGTVYWSGADGYGKMIRNALGLLEMQSLSKNVKDVFQSLIVRNAVYFLSQQTIFTLPESNSSPTLVNATDETGSFVSMFELFGTLYINTEKGGILKWINGRLVASTLGFSHDQQVIFSCGTDNHYLIGLSNNKVYTCGENLKPREVNIEDRSYVDASVVVNGAWVNKELFALGTLRGGMVFIHAATGKTQEIINYNTGLPDNEVFTLMSDKNLGIWAAHEYGFTRVAPYLPFRSFSHYPGLQGNLLCALSYEDDVYVGTSLGLFKLQKEDVYQEINYYVDVEIKSTKKAASPPVKSPSVPILKVATEEEKPQAVEESESKKRGFLRFRKKKRSKEEKTVIVPQNPKAVDTVLSSPEVITEQFVEEPKFKKEKRTHRILRTSQYVYKKVEGIDAKITQLVNINGVLFAAGLGGTYEVENIKSKALVEEPTRYIFGSADGLLFISTYADKVKVFHYASNAFIKLDLLERINDQVNSIFEGNKGQVWLCGVDKMYKLDTKDQLIQKVEAIEINNQNYDDYLGMRWNNQVIIANSQNFLHYEPRKNSFVLIDSLSGKQALNYFGDKQTIWYQKDHSWHILGKYAAQSNLHLLNLFQNVRFIASDEVDENLWIITGNNELYKFYGERFTPYEIGFPVVLKSVTNNDGEIGSKGNYIFEEEKSPLKFKIVQPDYLASQAITYRYELEGLEKDWTEWSNINNQIDFPYLPSGEYTLRVQSRDIFGKVREMPPVYFKILPPYWQRPWFYALEFVVFAALVVLSFRLSTRYRIISRILSLITIIMLIQLIQTIIGERFETRTSPVIDFFVQVLVAFLILPVEGYLRNLMLRSLDTKGDLYKILSPKTTTIVQAEPQEHQEH